MYIKQIPECTDLFNVPHVPPRRKIVSKFITLIYYDELIMMQVNNALSGTDTVSVPNH